ncbi:hypothetical protein [Shewanella phaeophyticola]|uniref:Urocanase Rossmann-like domain-containing protein n=1 Tax=Shewanella phaeophyticola TaxID=2978345 RepID=A0ABT2P9V7_9GAMM|nr:hypothetical protein [Shewanella sp. KJ10-1]MCT8988376.1 hypothetical protein [Shewanella sp. KJ10-1]
MLALQAAGAATTDYGNNIRQMAFEEGVSNAFDFPGFVPAYVRPLFCEGIVAIPLGSLVWRSRRYLQNRCQS